MKKLAITQIILGMLVVGSLIYWMGWLSTGYFHYVGTDPDGNIILGVLGLHKPNPFMEVWAVVYLVLGLSVLGCGIAQYLKARRQSAGIGDKPERRKHGGEGMKLAITQIVSGVLIIGSLVWFIGWVEPGYGSYTKLYKDVEVVFHPLPGWIMRLTFWKVVSFVLGLAILGCGIAQVAQLRGLRKIEG